MYTDLYKFERLTTSFIKYIAPDPKVSDVCNHHSKTKITFSFQYLNPSCRIQGLPTCSIVTRICVATMKVRTIAS